MNTELNPELRDLYQDIIIEHGRRPRHHHVMTDATHHALGHNPLCGDKIELYLKLNHDTIEEVSFTGVGCAISMASASLLTEVLRDKTITQARDLFTHFHDAVMGQAVTDK